MKENPTKTSLFEAVNDALGAPCSPKPRIPQQFARDDGYSSASRK